MNKQLLRSIMTKYGETQKDLADAMGLSLSRLNAKINSNGADFRQNEISFIKERYKLNSKDIDHIFFENKVSLKDALSQ